jgi:hypothetical protein
MPDMTLSFVAGIDTENAQKFGQPLPADFDRDEARVNYYHDYLTYILKSVRYCALHAT